MKCPKCGESMGQGGVMRSGNSKFQIYKCESCGHEEMECLGLE
ncbi:zf-TFIIB domain-containing protein [Candidatus Woesearchaeota archaeon]|nr:zf-TFIIB domain-containing protein [Candidatus Woesearchaeota archaeon]